MGHSAITTTSRYLHARAAGDQAKLFTAAVLPEAPHDALEQSEREGDLSPARSPGRA
jgi:hypothetical protein